MSGNGVDPSPAVGELLARGIVEMKCNARDCVDVGRGNTAVYKSLLESRELLQRSGTIDLTESVGARDVADGREHLLGNDGRSC